VSPRGSEYTFHKLHLGWRECPILLRKDHYNIIEHYPNNGIAWESISRKFPPQSLLMLEGMMLKKSTHGAWIPIILSYDKNVRNEIENMSSKFRLLDFI